MNPSTALARVIIDELIQNGVTDAVLAPGSRNSPLSMALAGADAEGRCRLHVRFDERTAGFLAVGLARASGKTVPVVTTSGTAVANLHPSVLEAHHSGVPLLVLSADRPPALRDVGANQVIDQHSVFGSALRFFHEFGVAAERPGQNAVWRSMVCRALAHTRGAGSGWPGPVQLNVPLAEPLLPGADQVLQEWPEPLTGRAGPWTELDTMAAEELLSGVDAPPGRTPMIAAPADGERVLFLADLTHPAAGPLAALGHVVLSEAGGAAGAAVVSTGMHLVQVKGFLEPALPDRVVVLGRPTLYRQIGDLLANSMITVDVLAPTAGYADPAGRVRTVAPVLAPLTGPGNSEFVMIWRNAERRAAAALTEAVAGLPVDASPRSAAELVAGLSPGTTLFLGSSQPPRDVGLAAAARDGLRLLANRGVAGIDGSVSSAVGVALASPGPRTVAYLGDLTFLHDATGLFLGPREPRPELTIVVSNNNGGGIFNGLEPGEDPHRRHFERIFGTPPGADLAALCRSAGWAHDRVDAASLRPRLAAATGLTVLEVPTTRTNLRALHATLHSAVSAAVRS